MRRFGSLLLVVATVPSAGLASAQTPPQADLPPIVSPTAPPPASPVGLEQSPYPNWPNREVKRFLLAIDGGFTATEFSSDGNDYVLLTASTRALIGWRVHSPWTKHDLGLALGYLVEIGFDDTAVIQRHQVALDLQRGSLLAHVGIGPVFVSTVAGNVAGAGFSGGPGIELFGTRLYLYAPIGIDVLVGTRAVVGANYGISLGYRTL